MGKGSSMTVKWIIDDKNKKCIKFKESDDMYNIAEDVKLDDIKTGVSVDVEIEDNIVTSLKVEKEQKKETKKSEKPKEKVETKSEETEVEEPVVVSWTVSAITSKKDVCKFEEQKVEKYWYPIKEEIRSSFEDVTKGAKVTVKIGKVDATAKSGEVYQKDGVIGIKKDEIVKPKKEDKGEDKKQPETCDTEQPQRERNPGTTNDSIERQVALKGAIELIKDKGQGGIKDIESELKKLTKICFQAMQDA